MTKDERASLEVLLAATNRLIEAQEGQAKRLDALIEALHTPAREMTVEAPLPDLATLAQVLKPLVSPPRQPEWEDAPPGGELEEITHLSDEPLTLYWNGFSLTLMPGPNLVPSVYANLYRQWQRDVQFQKENQKRLANVEVLSRELQRMAGEEEL